MAWTPPRDDDQPADESGTFQKVERAGWGDEPWDEEKVPAVPLRQRVVADVLTGVRFAQERPASLVEHLAMAKRGEWTAELDGWRRHLAVTWVYVVAVPVAVLAHLAIWQTARMTRCLSMLAVELLVTTALHRMPLFAWLLPDWSDIAAWWPLNLL